MSQITIILGSISDKLIFEKAKAIFNMFEIKYDLRIVSAHRTPEKIEEIVKNSNSEIFIAMAGLSAALPGVIAANTIKPVIGVPIESKLDGLDALLSIVQMPPGIPVACVGIDRGENAALLAIEILALKNDDLKNKLNNYRKKMKEKINNDNKEAQQW